MLIRFSHEVALQLETIMVQAHGRQVSGVGFVKWDPTVKEFHVYKIVLMNIGAKEIASISTERVLELVARSKDADAIRLWWHSHDIGDGYPDADNWSASDERICREEPLGLLSEDMGWSISVVRTPLGWVGRYDIYGENANTYHLQVLPNYALSVDERLQKILGFPQKTTISSSPIVERYNSGSCFDYEAFSDEYEDVKILEKPSQDYEYWDDDVEPERNDDNDDGDDSFEQFVFMGGLDPDNW